MDENSKTLSLNLSTSVRQDLRAFNNSDLLNSPESFDYLLHKIFEVLMTIPNKASKNDISKEMQGHKGFAKFKVSLINQWTGSLMTFLVKAAGENASVDNVTICLTDLGWTSQYVSKLSKLYETNQLKIRAILKLFQSSPPSLVDIRWRMDVKLESSISGQLGELWYIIDMVLEDNGVQETLTFEANHSQLEDLVATLKDAHNSAKRFSTT